MHCYCTQWGRTTGITLPLYCWWPRLPDLAKTWQKRFCSSFWVWQIWTFFGHLNGSRRPIEHHSLHFAVLRGCWFEKVFWSLVNWKVCYILGSRWQQNKRHSPAFKKHHLLWLSPVEFEPWVGKDIPNTVEMYFQKRLNFACCLLSTKIYHRQYLN